MMRKLGETVIYVTEQGHPRMAFVSAEVVEEAPIAEEEPVSSTGPALTLHVLLHSNDADYVKQGALAIYAGVRYSDKKEPGTWHDVEIA